MPETVTPERPTPITGAQLREHYRGEATAAGLELDDADHALLDRLGRWKTN